MTIETLLEAVEDGRTCGFCGQDIRLNIDMESDEYKPANFDEGDSATPGERGLCQPCTDAGNDKDGYQEEMPEE